MIIKVSADLASYVPRTTSQVRKLWLQREAPNLLKGWLFCFLVVLKQTKVRQRPSHSQRETNPMVPAKLKNGATAASRSVVHIGYSMLTLV